MFWVDYWVIRLSILINCYKVCMMHVCYSCHSAAASVLKARVRVVGPRLGVSKLMSKEWGWFRSMKEVWHWYILTMYNIIGLGNQIEKDLFCARFPKQPVTLPHVNHFILYLKLRVLEANLHPAVCQAHQRCEPNVRRRLMVEASLLGNAAIPTPLKRLQSHFGNASEICQNCQLWFSARIQSSCWA